ncbi:MAG: hypothetical protein SNJ74_12850 [Fimbriimonadaceae bacterium]
MNAQKAREYFSSYYEGVLERGLRESLERKFQSDPAVKADYDSFVRTMKAIEQMRDAVPEPPENLHETIMARLDRQIWEARRKPVQHWLGWWKPALAGSLACLAIVAAINQIGRPSDTSQAAIAPTPNDGVGAPVRPTESMTAQINDSGGVTFVYSTAAERRVVVRSEDGRIRSDATVNASTLRYHLTNEHPAAEVVSIEVGDSGPVALVALPGTSMERNGEGSGNLRDLIRASAGFFRTPIVLAASDASLPVTWNFSSQDPVAELTRALPSSRYSVEQRPSGLVWVERN